LKNGGLGRGGRSPKRRAAPRPVYFDPPLSFSFWSTSSILKLAAFCR
jgi:hypothetical protein